MLRNEEAAWQLVALRPELIREVHLLFAGKSSAAASRFGHVALRLVVCPDEASMQSDSPDRCYRNVYQHVVFGFQAYIDDSDINIHQALWGGYQARLVAQRFMETYEQYTTVEFRELYSLPLRIDEREKQQLIDGLVQLHWMHESDYRFFSNNCSTLLQDSLAALWPNYAETPDVGDVRIKRPNYFFKRMQDAGLVDAALVDDKTQALRQGFYFSSNKKAYESAATMLAAASENPFFEHLDSYLKEPLTERHERLLNDEPLQAAMQANPRLAITPILLEEYALLMAEKNILRAAAKVFRFEDGKVFYQGQASINEAKQNLIDRCLVAPLKSRLLPPAVQHAIPLAGQINMPAISDACSDEQNQALRELLVLELQQTDKHWATLLAAMVALSDQVEHLDDLKIRQASYGI